MLDGNAKMCIKKAHIRGLNDFWFYKVDFYVMKVELMSSWRRLVADDVINE